NNSSGFSRYAAAGKTDNYLRPYTQYARLGYGTNAGLLWYDSLQVSIRRNTGMLKTNVNFTYSKTENNTDQEGNGLSTPLDIFYFTPGEFVQFIFHGLCEIGNSGRNSFRRPVFWNIDSSLVKRFKITESQLVAFRAEAYNIFNHPSFGTPGGSLTAPGTFGK